MRYQEHYFKTVGQKGFIGGAAIIQPKSLNREERSVRWVLTEETPDRSVIVDEETAEAGDIVRVEGIRFHGEKLPILQFHDYGRHSVGIMTDMGVDGERFIGTARFNPEGVNPEADIWWGQIAAGHHDTGSIGFVPIVWEQMKDEEGERDRDAPIDFQKSYLIEYSMVPVPMLQTSTALGFSPDEYELTQVCADIIGANPHVTTKEQVEEMVATFSLMLLESWLETCTLSLPERQAEEPKANLGEPAAVVVPAKKSAIEIARATASHIKAQMGL